MRSRLGAFWTLALAALAAVMLAPLVWVVLGSLKPSNLEVFDRPFAVPSRLTTENYVRAVEEGRMASYFVNSTLVTGLSVLLVVVLGAWAGFALSKRSLPGRGLLVALFLVGMALPVEAYLIPLGGLLNALGIQDSLWALILPYTAQNLPVAILLYAAYFAALPRELEETARLDGLSTARFYAHILLPVAQPVVATVAILTTLATWNEFLMALLFVLDPARKTLPAGMIAFQQSHTTDYPALLAGLSMISLVSLLGYVVFNEQVVKGVVAGAVK